MMRLVCVFLGLLYVVSLIPSTESYLAGTVRRNMDVNFRNIHLKNTEQGQSYILVTGNTQTPVGTITITCGASTNTLDIVIQADGPWEITESDIWVGSPTTYPSAPVDPTTFPNIQNPAFPGGHFSVWKSVAVDPSWVVNGEINVAVHTFMQQLVYTQASLQQIASSPVPTGPCGTNFIRNIYSSLHTTSYYLSDLDGFFFDGWAVDSSKPAVIEQRYPAQLISSYSDVFSTAAGLNYVDQPGNLPIANYIINNVGNYLNADSVQCDIFSIQNAILYFLANNPTYIPVPSNDCFNFIIADAQANGANYVPPCPDGRYLVIVVPIDPNTCNQADAQVTAIAVGGICFIGQCETLYSGAEGWGIEAGTTGITIPGDTSEARVFNFQFSC